MTSTSTDYNSKENIETLNTLASLVAKLSIVPGLLLVLIYCISINFYPRNIQIGDGLFFIWVTLIFGFLISVVTFIFSAWGYSFVRFIKLITPEKISGKIPTPPNPKGYYTIHLFTVSFLLLFFLAWLGSTAKLSFTFEGAIKGVVIVVVAFFNGVIASSLLSENDNNSKPKAFKYLILLSLFVFPCIAIKGFFANTLDNAMNKLGVREHNVTVFVDKTLSEVIKSSTNDPKLIIKVNDNIFKLKNAVVEFQGVGDTNQVRLCLKQSCPSIHIEAKKMTVVKRADHEKPSNLASIITKAHGDFLKSSGIKFNKRELVFSFPETIKNYELGSDAPSKFNGMLQSELLFNVLPTLSKNTDEIESIEIIGYSSSKWKDSEDSLDAYSKNLVLSQARALHIVERIKSDQRLVSHFNWLIPKLVFVGKASSQKSEQSIEIKLVLNN
jgi:hypothetical protein